MPILEDLNVNLTSSGFTLSFSIPITNPFPASFELGYISLIVGLKNGETALLKMDSRNILIKRKAARISFSLTATLGTSKELAREINALFHDFFNNRASEITISGIEFGSSEATKFTILSKIVLKRNCKQLRIKF